MHIYSSLGTGEPQLKPNERAHKHVFSFIVIMPSVVVIFVVVVQAVK